MEKIMEQENFIPAAEIKEQENLSGEYTNLSPEELIEARQKHPGLKLIEDLEDKDISFEGVDLLGDGKINSYLFKEFIKSAKYINRRLENMNKEDLLNIFKERLNMYVEAADLEDISFYLYHREFEDYKSKFGEIFGDIFSVKDLEEIEEYILEAAGERALELIHEDISENYEKLRAEIIEENPGEELEEEDIQEFIHENKFWDLVIYTNNIYFSFIDEAEGSDSLSELFYLLFYNKGKKYDDLVLNLEFVISFLRFYELRDGYDMEYFIMERSENPQKIWKYTRNIFIETYEK